MRIEKWLKNNTASLAGKTVAITGATGGLGQKLCGYLLKSGARLILCDRDPARSHALGERLKAACPGGQIRYCKVDLENIGEVKAACQVLQRETIDILLLNAGAYSIPRHFCDTGYDNVFQINFASPYYMARILLPTLRERGGRVVAVGSIAHRYSVTDPADPDFSGRKRASLVYGNAKRMLMFSLYALFRKERQASLAIVHPGISFTGITAHYPKVIFALIKHPMKWIFMKPEKACLSILRGVFEKTGDQEWIGPRFFDVWGKPKKKTLYSATEEEQKQIAHTAETVYARCKNRAERRGLQF